MYDFCHMDTEPRRNRKCRLLNANEITFRRIYDDESRFELSSCRLPVMPKKTEISLGAKPARL